MAIDINTARLIHVDFIHGKIFDPRVVKWLVCLISFDHRKMIGSRAHAVKDLKGPSGGLTYQVPPIFE